MSTKTPSNLNLSTTFIVLKSIKSKAFLSRKKNKKKGRNQEKERKEIGGEKKEGKVKKERDHP